VLAGFTSASLVRWLLARRPAVLAVAFVLSLVAGWQTARTYGALRSDLEELLPESAPSVAALRELRQRMPGLRHLGVVVDTGGRLADANRFVDALAERIRRYPPELVGAVRTDVAREREFAETRVLSLMDPADVKKLTDAVEKRRDWEVSRAMDLGLDEEAQGSAPSLPIAELRDKYEARHGKHARLPGDRFVSADGRTVVVLVQASSHATGYGADRELLDRVRKDVAELGPGFRVGYAGDVATRVEEMDGLVTDLGFSGVFVLLAVVLAVIAFYRSWRAVPILWLPLAAGTLYTFGLVALPPLSIRHLNSNTAFLGSIVVGNGINSGIMLLSRFWEERRRGLSLERALSISLDTTWAPTLAASLAAAAAYGSLVFTDFRGFNQFGWIGAAGMIVCWAANMLLIPVFVSLFAAHSIAPERNGTRSIGARVTGALLARPRFALGIMFAVTTLAAIGLSKRAGDWIEYDLSKLRRRDSWEHGERYWGQRMDRTLGRYLTPTVVLADDAEHARRIEARVRELAEKGQAGGLIASVRSVNDVLPPNREKALSEARRLREVLTPKLEASLSPDDRRLVRRALSPEALSPLRADELPDALVAGLREHDGRMDRAVLVFPELGSGTWDAARMKSFADDLRSAAWVDGKPAHVAGSLVLSSDIADAMKSDGPRATLLALLSVLAICVFTFRSVGLSLAAVAALGAGVMVMLGFVAWSGQRLNFSNFVALPITFGIGADYSINMLKRWQTEGRISLEAALSATGGAVALCSVMTVIGFGSLLVARNQALFSFGVFAVSGELASLGTAVLGLPAVLALVSARLTRARALAVAPPSE
jgi:predicted RND superfamily exporter protein